MYHTAFLDTRLDYEERGMIAAILIGIHQFGITEKMGIREYIRDGQVFTVLTNYLHDLFNGQPNYVPTISPSYLFRVQPPDCETDYCLDCSARQPAQGRTFPQTDFQLNNRGRKICLLIRLGIQTSCNYNWLRYTQDLPGTLFQMGTTGATQHIFVDAPLPRRKDWCIRSAHEEILLDHDMRQRWETSLMLNEMRCKCLTGSLTDVKQCERQIAVFAEKKRSWRRSKSVKTLVLLHKYKSYPPTWKKPFDSHGHRTCVGWCDAQYTYLCDRLWYERNLTPFPDPVETARHAARKQKEDEIERMRRVRLEERRRLRKDDGICMYMFVQIYMFLDDRRGLGYGGRVPCSGAISVAVAVTATQTPESVPPTTPIDTSVRLSTSTAAYIARRTRIDVPDVVADLTSSDGKDVCDEYGAVTAPVPVMPPTENKSVTTMPPTENEGGLNAVLRMFDSSETDENDEDDDTIDNDDDEGDDSGVSRYGGDSESDGRESLNDESDGED
jgi:hypothetical protein